MAHNINFNERTGRYSFFSVQQKAWHGLGQIVEQFPTSEEAIKYAGLDYEVVKSPIFTKNSGIIETASGIEIGSSELEVPNYFANIRTDNNAVLGVVGKDYHIVQNREAFNFFDAIVGGGEVFCTKPQAHWATENVFLLQLNYPIIFVLAMAMMLRKSIFF